MTDVDRQLQRSREVLDRSRERFQTMNQRARRRREAEVLKRVGRIAAADAAIVVAALVVGWIMPLGMGGALVVMALLIAATLGLAIFPVTPEPTPEKFDATPLRALPLQTEIWMEKQRASVPPAALGLFDSIGQRLETLAPQVASLDEREPAAGEVRKLIGEQLPELIKGYQRVPDPLRRVERHGLTPDQQLMQGLELIDQEIAQMTAQLAEGDLDLLATRGRFLQIKYRDDEIGG